MSHTDDSFRVTHEQNRRSWNAVTPAHNSHKHDQAGFLRGDGSTLFSQGRGRVFVHDGAGTCHSRYIKSSNTAPGDAFGYGVTLSDDGNTVAVGAFGEDGGSIRDQCYHRAWSGKRSSLGLEEGPSERSVSAAIAQAASRA